MSRGGALLRGLAGMLTAAVALGFASGVGRILTSRGVDALTMQASQAALMLGFVVALVVILSRAWDRRSLRSLGVAGHPSAGFARGLVVALATGALVWLPAFALGWARLDGVDPATLGRFLVINTALLACFEAIPEELALRGYAWTNLAEGWGPRWATALTTMLFVGAALLAPVVSGLVGGAANGAGPVGGPGEVVIYVIQLVLFGLALAVARASGPDGLLVAIGFHLGQLTVTRLVLGGLGWLPAGLDIALASPEVAILVWVHIVGGGLAFWWVARRGWVSEAPWSRHRAGRR